MLYDPKWEQKTETKADPFQIGSLIAWLEQQKPLARYDYSCNGHCLLSQYFTAAGFKNVFMYPFGFTHGPQPLPIMNGPEARLQPSWTQLPPQFDYIAIEGSRTFGAALKRARAVAAHR